MFFFHEKNSGQVSLYQKLFFLLLHISDLSIKHFIIVRFYLAIIDNLKLIFPHGEINLSILTILYSLYSLEFFIGPNFSSNI